MLKWLRRKFRARQQRIDEKILFPTFHRVASSEEHRDALNRYGLTAQDAYEWMIAEHKRIDPAWRDD